MTPIRDYALIGNCETAALIGPEGGIDWLCLPSFDAPSIFARLLDDEKGGTCTLKPKEPFEVERAYFADSAILQTRFKTKNGIVRLTDFFVIARTGKARFYDFTSLQPTRKLVRLVETEAGGPVEMELRVSARPDYARTAAAWRDSGSDGYAIDKMTLFTNVPLAREGDDLLGQFLLAPREPRYLVFDYAEERRPPTVEQISRWLEITKAFWREWNLFNYYEGPHRKLVRRSAVTLKLLTYAGTGAFVAAPTTSLPEGLGGKLNWDYRYTWLRDTALFIQTLFGLGYSGEARAFLDFAVAKWSEKAKKHESDSDTPTVEVVYPVCNRPIPPETKLDHLAGYGNSRPVRIGNRATEQFQLDNYGHVLQSLFCFRHTGGKIDAQKRKMVRRLTAEATRLWPCEDNGIWEEPDVHKFTYGKVMCWVALQRAIALLGDKEGAIAKAGAAIRDEIMRRGLTNKGGEQNLSARLDQPVIDASSFLAFTTGFLPERVARRTREAIEQELGREPLIYRSEGSEKKEGTFLLCSFWWINHLIREGDLQRAEELLSGIIARVSPLGLLSEEIDPKSGEFLGNFPQAFSHLGLIQSILNLEAAKKHPRLCRSAGSREIPAYGRADDRVKGDHCGPLSSAANRGAFLFPGFEVAGIIR